MARVSFKFTRADRSGRREVLVSKASGQARPGLRVAAAEPARNFELTSAFELRRAEGCVPPQIITRCNTATNDGNTWNTKGVRTFSHALCTRRN